LAALFDRCSLVVHAVVSRALPRTASPREIDQVVEDVFWRLWQTAGADAPTLAAVISETIGRSRGQR
jgi:hypothetical protein